MRRRPSRRLPALACALAAGALAAGAAPARAEVASVLGGDVPCTTVGDGTRSCGAVFPRATTRTFDGVPLDVEVSLPPAAVGGDGPYPLVIFIHGWTRTKLGLPDMRRWVDRGFATLTLSPRGHGESCGSVDARAADPAGCANGYSRFVDTRYEIRDVQELAGRLVDDGRIDPARIGVYGASAGGGATATLVTLKDRKMLPDGTLVPWISPAGVPLSIAAGASSIGWSDLAAALAPNGSTLDYIADATYRGRPGVFKEALMESLNGSALDAGTFSPTPPIALRGSFSGWRSIFERDSYSGNADVTGATREMTAFHSAFGIAAGPAPAPLLMINGLQDDLFGVEEGVRIANRLRARHPGAVVALFASSFGHGRGLGKAADTEAADERTTGWLTHYLGGGGPVPDTGVEIHPITCPAAAAPGPVLRAATWSGVAAGELRLTATAAKVVTGAGDPLLGATLSPNRVPTCATTPAADQAGTATYRMPPLPDGGGVLVAGAPTVVADLTAPAKGAQLAARLFDVAPDGTQLLVARGFMRPTTSARASRQVFQLQATAWRVAAGHALKLELLSADAPQGRPSADQGRVTVHGLDLRVPVAQAPGGRVLPPAGKVLPAGAALARDLEPDPAQPVDTQVASGPSATVRERAGRFTFTSPQGGASFECRVDGAPFLPCSGPGAAHAVGRTGPGAHEFAVRAVDAYGRADPTPATRAFRVLTGSSAGRRRAAGDPRPLPLGLGLRLDRRRDRTLPYRFRVGGRLAGARGVTLGEACRGLVRVQVRRGGRLVLGRELRVGADCRYAGDLRLSSRARGALTLRVAFLGSVALAPLPLGDLRLRAG